MDALIVIVLWTMFSVGIGWCGHMVIMDGRELNNDDDEGVTK